jgi:hypothetical protein
MSESQASTSRNTTAVLNDVIVRGCFARCPLIATDGFAYYRAAILRLVGPACVYGQVLKTRRNDRVVRVDRRVKIGTARRPEDALPTTSWLHERRTAA